MQKPSRILTVPNYTSHLAVTAGMLLGWLARELTHAPGSELFNLATALILVGSGSASFVFGALHLKSQHSRMSRDILANETRRCVTWLGAGILIAMQVVPLLFP